MLAIVCLLIGALGLVVSVALISWKAALVLVFVFVFVAGLDLSRPTRQPATFVAAPVESDEA